MGAGHFVARVGLDPDAPVEEIPVRAESGIVQRPITSLIPLAVLLLAVAAVVTPLWWWWLRRGATPPALLQPVEPRRPQLPIEQWSTAGEHRAVLAAASDTVRHTLAGHFEELPAASDTDTWIEAVERETDAPWDGATVVALLRDIDQARFRPEDPRAVLDLYRRALAVATPPQEFADQ